MCSKSLFQTGSFLWTRLIRLDRDKFFEHNLMKFCAMYESTLLLMTKYREMLVKFESWDLKRLRRLRSFVGDRCFNQPIC